ncbi:hypothetical protein KEM48_011813 [Puccinia striiformis f. sp. tritici PST-130]|nr:hypothetical protein KEM48_011813 [Puccinia striiformis f. sp. tritici PST-130]
MESFLISETSRGEYQGRDILKSVAAFGNPVTHLSRHYGVKLIIPIINQLIRHRYGIYGYKDAGNRIDFFKDRIMIDSFKKLITFFLERVNTYNGIRYGDDNTILAFETGNEMSWGQFANLSAGPAPSKVRPSYFIFSVDGTDECREESSGLLRFPGTSKRWHQKFYSRHPEVAWEQETLESPYVDLFSYHFYGGGDTEAFDMLNNKVRASRKTLVIGEHGFCHNIHGYHVPGWRNQTSQEFDTQEDIVIATTYQASYTILGLEPPPKPIPDRPDVFIVTNGSHPGLSWRGEAWAAGYEIFGAEAWGREFNLISDIIPDNVEAGGIFIPLNPQRPSELLNMKPPKSKSDESHNGWTDRKWCRKRSILGCHGLEKLPDGMGRDVLGNLVGQNSMKVLPSMEPERGRHRPGGWYSVRGVSADGIPGKRSRPVFLKTDWHN